MKNRKLIISLIIILSIIAVLLLLFMFGLLTGNFGISNFKYNYKVSNELVIDETYDMSFTKINIDSNASNIYIKNSNDENTKLIIYGDKENIKVDTSNNVLNISSKEKPCIGICFNRNVSKIEVYLNKDYDKDIKITNKFGDIEIADFVNANFDIEENAGNISIEKGNNVNILSKYGDTKVTTLNVGNIIAKAGDVEVNYANDIVIDNSLGNIKITTVSNYLNLKNNCGDIKLGSINLKENSSIKDDLGDVKIGKTNEIYIDAKTSLGDVKINNNYNKSDVILKIENSCGDIEVDN